MAKEIRLETLNSFFGVDFTMKDYMMGIDLKHKGLDIPYAKIGHGGIKTKQEFLLPNGEVAVDILFSDVIENNELVKIKKVTNYYYEDGTIYCSKTEHEIVRDLDSVLRKRYDRAYTFLRKSAKGTAIEFHVNTILEHYASEVSVWLLGSPQTFIDAVNNETDGTILAYLDIVIHESGKKVKDSIIEQLTGVAWTPQT